MTLKEISTGLLFTAINAPSGIAIGTLLRPDNIPLAIVDSAIIEWAALSAAWLITNIFILNDGHTQYGPDSQGVNSSNNFPNQQSTRRFNSINPKL